MCENTSVLRGFLPFEGAILAFRTKLGLHEYSITLDQSERESKKNTIIPCSRSVNFLIFAKFLLVRMWVIFPRVSHYIYLVLCVCFAFAYTFLREHLSEVDNEFATENKLLFIQLSQKWTIILEITVKWRLAIPENKFPSRNNIVTRQIMTVLNKSPFSD